MSEHRTVNKASRCEPCAGSGRAHSIFDFCGCEPPCPDNGYPNAGYCANCKGRGYIAPEEKRVKLVYPLAYIATIFAANWAIATFGVIPVGFGLMAPAAVVFAGLAFGLRDLTQDTFGRGVTVAAILVGAGLSAFVSPAFALASGVAFLVSEFADLVVYTPLRARNWYGAVVASNAVGLVIDSAIFLWLAFGSFQFLAGQIVGKAEVTLAFLAVAWLVRNRGLLPRYA